MKIKLLFCLIFSGFFFFEAIAGDTIVVKAQQDRDLVWYQRYRDWADFPANKEFHHVNMQFTMGCASGGCSDWDYTVLVFLLKPTGKMDSTIASIDTVSISPLVIDTVWNVTPNKERFELGRMITPYGGYMARNQHGYNNGWKHRFDFDVTDFQILMEDSVEIEVFYQGWSAGFSATIDFQMVEGTPPRRVRRIENIYTPGGYNYFTPQQFETDVLPPKKLYFEPGDHSAVLRFIPSGHGFINAVNCAEFCQRNYEVHINGTKTFEQLMWRDDCGLNPIHPQGGTWLYDRANWCPGSEVITYTHELSNYFSPGDSMDFDIDIEPIIYTVPPGETPANYNLSAQLITYEAPLRQRDAAITRIITPSDHEQNSRMNPSCGKAIVEIINKGSEPLTSVSIHYGINSAPQLKYKWTGNLAMMEKEIVELPFDQAENWYSFYGINQFQAWTVAPNGAYDQYPENDAQVTFFEAPRVLPADIRVFFRTNNRGDETFWHLKDASGVVIDSGDNLANNTLYDIPISLATGCYEFVLGDRGKNGLSFWANNDGGGFARLMSPNSTLQIFNPDFGTEIRYYFTVGFGLSSDAYQVSQRFAVFPNPTDGRVNIATEGQEVKVTVKDQMGRSVKKVTFKSDEIPRMDLSNLASGVYLVRIEDERGHEVYKIVLR
ncbi:MAG: T9SS type A sorting domain-containing protein [Cryomorphaceae bacterium]|nr:T9SS type A sorting domain-containing protein [Cryomorphaceae bacterium]